MTLWLNRRIASLQGVCQAYKCILLGESLVIYWTSQLIRLLQKKRTCEGLPRTMQGCGYQTTLKSIVRACIQIQWQVPNSRCYQVHNWVLTSNIVLLGYFKVVWTRLSVVSQNSHHLLHEDFSTTLLSLLCVRMRYIFLCSWFPFQLKNPWDILTNWTGKLPAAYQILLTWSFREGHSASQHPSCRNIMPCSPCRKYCLRKIKG